MIGVSQTYVYKIAYLVKYGWSCDGDDRWYRPSDPHGPGVTLDDAYRWQRERTR